MKIKTSVKASDPVFQHNQSAAGLKIQSSVKAGCFGCGIKFNHNQTSAAIKIQSSVKAGPDFSVLLGGGGGARAR